MYLLYIDESGQHEGNYFVLAGIAIFERRTFWLSSRLDQLQLKFLPDIKETVEFHATAIRARKEPPWCNLSTPDCRQLLDAVYDVIAEEQLFLFASVVERAWLKEEMNEYDWAFESMVNRFDRFLRWKYKDEGEPQRGLIIIAESQYQQRIETLASRIRQYGTRWGEAYNLADIPLFTMASNSRLLQATDFCANAVYGKFENGYGRQFDKLAPKFFQFDDIVHGLSHYSTGYDHCMCPGCLTRRVAGAKMEVPSDLQRPLL